MLLHLMPLKLWLAVGVIALTAVAFTWARRDAVSDAIAKAEAQAAKDRIKVIERRQERTHEIANLDDCKFLRDGIVGLSGDADAARAAFERCRAESAESGGGDSEVSGKE